MAEAQLADGEFEDDDLTPEGDEVSVEDRARAMGWKPREEHRGDPSRWRDAETFLRIGEQELPVMRDQNRRMGEKLARYERELGTLRNTVDEQSKAVKDAMDLARRADERGFQRGLKELQAKAREAVEAGDTQAYDQTLEQIEAAQREREVAAPVVEPKPTTTAAPPTLDPETTIFFSENPWFNQKLVLRNAMISAHSAIINAEGPAKGADLADQYARARAEVVEAYPSYFPEEQVGEPVTPKPAATPTPRPRLRPNVLDPSGAQPRAQRNASPFDRIEDPAERAEAKAAFARISQYDPECSADEYVSLIINPKQDVLALRSARKRA